jgi:sugar lactone lactonase YvrE
LIRQFFSMPASSKPKIHTVQPAAAIPGGEIQIRGQLLATDLRPRVRFGGLDAPVIVGSSEYVVARVPDGASGAELVIDNGTDATPAWNCEIGIQIADSVHPVANPAVDAKGNVFTTLSGQRGQKTPVAVYRVDRDLNVKPFLSDLMNATGLAFDQDGMLYVSSRHDGIVYECTPKGEMAVYVEGMGVATGLAFDKDDNLYVGDRSGTIFKIARSRQIYVFATVEPSVAAFHLAFSPAGDLFVSAPTTSSFDAVHRITPEGEVSVFYRGLGRPQGIAFDQDGNLYAAASLAGRRGIVRITPDAKAELFISGPNIVGLAFAPGGKVIVATNSALFRVNTDVRGYLPTRR